MPSYNSLAMLHRSEKDWELHSVLAYDGLKPTQVVRIMDVGPNGLEVGEGAVLPFKMDGATSADRETWTPVGSDRYVESPRIGRYELDGLWTGGPVEFERVLDDQRRMNHWRLKQTLTKTWRAEGESTAVLTLKEHRPAVKRAVAQTDVFAEEKQAEKFETEFVFRDFTHESRSVFEGLSEIDVASVLAFHCSTSETLSVASRECEIDAETNTLVFTVRTVGTDADVIDDGASVADLFSAPFYELPCEYEVLRRNGLGGKQYGEGTVSRHTFFWPVLRDSLGLRQLVDSGERSGYDAIKSYLEGDEIGDRYRMSGGDVSSAKIEKAEDGLVSVSIVYEQVKWHGADADAPQIIEAMSNESGLARVSKVIPSVPTSDAESELEDISAPNGYVVARRNAQEGPDGRSDLTVELARAYTYKTTDGATDAPGGASPSTEGVMAPTVDASKSKRKPTWRVSFPAVAEADVDDVVAAAKESVKNIADVVRVSHDMDELGLYTVSLMLESNAEVDDGAWITEVTAFVTTQLHRKYNVRKAALTAGSLANGVKVTETRELNDGGTYDETIRTETAKEVTTGPVAGQEVSGISQRATSTTTVRNATSLPTGEAAVASKGQELRISAQKNEFGLYDYTKTTAERYTEPTTTTVTTAGLYTETSTSGEGDGTAPTGGGSGSVTTYTTRVGTAGTTYVSTTREAKDGTTGPIAGQVVSGLSQASSTTESFVNASSVSVDTPDDGETVSVSGSVNEYGLFNYTVSRHDRVPEPDVSSSTKTALYTESTESGESVTASTADGGSGTVVTTSTRSGNAGVSVTTNTTRTSVAKDGEVSWTEESPDGSKTRTVKHTVYRNATDITVDGDYASASASKTPNEFGRFDGSVTTYGKWVKKDGGGSGGSETKTYKLKDTESRPKADGTGYEERTVTYNVTETWTTGNPNIPDGAPGTRVQAGKFVFPSLGLALYGWHVYHVTKSYGTWGGGSSDSSEADSSGSSGSGSSSGSTGSGSTIGSTSGGGNE